MRCYEQILYIREPCFFPVSINLAVKLQNSLNLEKIYTGRVTFRLGEKRKYEML